MKNKKILKVFLPLLLIIIVSLFVYRWYEYYFVIQKDEKELIAPILDAFRNGQESVYLRDFTNFEWDQVCHVDYRHLF